MKCKILLSFFFLLLIINSSAQNTTNKLVGFGCTKGNYDSEAVTRFTVLINNANYKEIIKLLDAKHSANKYLAIISTEKLIKLSKIRSTDEITEKLAKLYTSKKKLLVCAGCMYKSKLTIKEALKKDGKSRKIADYWLNNLLRDKE